MTVIILSGILYLISRITLLRNNTNVNGKDKEVIKEKLWSDYVTYSIFLLLKPVTSRQQHAFKVMWKKSNAGQILVLASIWSGFFIILFYCYALLKVFTVPMYEEPIKTTSGMI